LPAERAAVVPYGVNHEIVFFAQRTIARSHSPFTGTAELRKGFTTSRWQRKNLSCAGRYEFRVAGNVERSVANQEQCRHLKFLGRIPRAQIAGEFAAADLLVLPSLAEGSAETTYEALACGVPVVTTLEAGSVVRDGIDGRIVPRRGTPKRWRTRLPRLLRTGKNASGCHAPRATGHTIIRGTGTANACWLRSGKNWKADHRSWREEWGIQARQ